MEAMGLVPGPCPLLKAALPLTRPLPPLLEGWAPAAMLVPAECASS